MLIRYSRVYRRSVIQMSKSSTVPKAQHVQAVSSALKLLEHLSLRGQATLTELGRDAGLTHNHTFRLLATLEQEGFVARDARKTYVLGPQAYVLGQRADPTRTLVTVAGPHLDALHALSGETVLLAVRVDLERMVVERRTAVHSLRVDWPLGSRLPLYVGGLGVSLLAFAPLEVQQAVLEGERHAYTERTLVGREALVQELERVRLERVRVSVDDYANGEFAIAAPILDPPGIAVGAVNIAGFTERLTPDKLERYKEAVRRAGAAIGEALYGRGSRGL